MSNHLKTIDVLVLDTVTGGMDLTAAQLKHYGYNPSKWVPTSVKDWRDAPAPSFRIPGGM